MYLFFFYYIEFSHDTSPYLFKLINIYLEIELDLHDYYFKNRSIKNKIKPF